VTGKQLILPGSIGTSGAIKAVLDGAIELGLASRPLNAGEISQGLKELPYARIGIVIAVNQNVPEDNISHQDLVDIFSGVKSTWQNGAMIVVESREEGDSSNRVLAQEIPGFGEALTNAFKNKRWQINYSDTDEVQAIIDTSYAIGLSDTGALAVTKPMLKPLKIDGIAPTIANVENGRYRYYKVLTFIYKEPLEKESRQFIEFVFSDPGQKIIRENGGIPLSGDIN